MPEGSSAFFPSYNGGTADRTADPPDEPAGAAQGPVIHAGGDRRYDAGELARPLPAGGVDIADGYKIKRAERLQREAPGAVCNRLAHLLFNIPIRDVDCDFRPLRRRGVGGIGLFSPGGSIRVGPAHKLRRAGFAAAAVGHRRRAHALRCAAPGLNACPPTRRT
jgi:hypothetical protein